MPAFLTNALTQLPNWLLLIFGFGFVIFWHELGHFIAAKWAGVKVEQFAVGFGQALISWRKGLGYRWGSSAKEYEQLAQAAKEGVQKRDISQISETEYRLNWIPLGGYVKMLGQDDLNPTATANDPRPYNMKPISRRLEITASRADMDDSGFLALGITPSPQLEGPDARKELPTDWQELKKYSTPDSLAVEPGEKIVAINGEPIDPNDRAQLQSYWRLD